ncbi:hypothetical protein AWB82_03173 [Caballeronia glebae]|uniref:Uncharacterized protein n=1 Tax=Caballeronia glebae TaxID=1777143 RepID=A0A158AYG4_9BURK|nr:hypothetical protein [Caballeronia glebae]SAK62486.1 hypothetical protein AWB82_03173 [Caballeronia glebae]
MQARKIMQSDVLTMARKSGMTILLDGRIGQQEYMSASGSADALQKFAHEIRASVSKEPRRKVRAARSPSMNALVVARMREGIAACVYRGSGAPRHRRPSPRGPRFILRRRSSAGQCAP